MKKVWVLERLVPVEETKKSIKDCKAMLETEDADAKEMAEQVIAKLEQSIKDYPDGYWLGYVGKSNYRDFCMEAKDFMQRHKDDLLKTGVRAVKADIQDGAKYWVGYKNGIVNDGVTKYLYATYKEW